MDLSLLLGLVLLAPDPQPGLPSHQHALAQCRLASDLEKQCFGQSYILSFMGHVNESWRLWYYYEDQRGRAGMWRIVVDATDPARPWLLRRASYQELVDRLGARAVVTGEMVCPFGPWVPEVR